MLHRIVGILIIVFSLTGAWLWMEYDRFVGQPLDLPPGGLRYTLEPGTSVARLAADLQQRSYLDSALYLRLLARFEGQAQQIKAGEYQIPNGTTPRQLLAQLVSGKVTRYTLTLVEGWNFKQVMAAIRGSEALRQTLEGAPAAEIMRRLGHDGEHPEGRFLPDTYQFPRATTDLAFLQRAYDSMQSLLAREWSQRAEGLPLKDPYEALILASIIEKETGKESERAQIAGVFIRRLNRGMRLQTDPTVIYGMGDTYKGNIRRRDLKRDTPYNTYLRKGLTPTPISMPGAGAIHAALHPAAGNTLYFVAKGDGSHQFSATLKEHNRAVRKYQLKK